VLEIPRKEPEKQGPVEQFEANLHSMSGHTSNVMVVPQSKRLTTAWDCCILQYCLITHFFKKVVGGRSSVMAQRLASSLKKQSPKTAGKNDGAILGRIHKGEF